MSAKKGAGTIEAPLDTSFGDRRTMADDPFGKGFPIAHPISS